MDAPEETRRNAPDPERLQQGLDQLRALGYLRTPAETYLARRVVGHRSRGRTAAAAGAWIGGGVGVLAAVLLTVSATVTEPGLAQRPMTLVWLWVELTVVLSIAAAVPTGLAAWSVLLGRSSGAKVGRGVLERILLSVPALLAAAYLSDRLGRAILPGSEGPDAWIAILGVVLIVGAVGALVAWTLAGALTLARMQSAGEDHGSESAPRPPRQRRTTAWLLSTAIALFVLLIGPYRSLGSLPALEQVRVDALRAPTPTFVLGIEGLGEVGGRTGSDAWRPALPSSGGPEEHPAAYWNEIATGFDPSEHGVADAAAVGLRGWERGVGELRQDPLLDLLLRQLLPGVGLGRTFAADRRDLRRPPVWEVAAHAGRRARVVNWWATYPAARREGLEVVTDREVLRLDDGQDRDSHVAWPATLRTADVERWRAHTDSVLATFSTYVEGRRRLVGTVGAGTPLVDAWDLAASSDLHHLSRATAGLTLGIAPSLVMVHLNGADILRRALERSEGSTPEGVLEDYQGLLSALLAHFSPPEGFRTVWILRATEQGPGGPRTWVSGEGAPREPRAWAAWLLWSQGVPPARDLELPADMDETVFVDARPATYGRLVAAEGTASRPGADLERLRSLGYIGD